MPTGRYLLLDRPHNKMAITATPNTTTKVITAQYMCRLIPRRTPPFRGTCLAGGSSALLLQGRFAPCGKRVMKASHKRSEHAGAPARLPVPPPAARLRKDEVIVPGKLTRREWAKRINDQWKHIRETAVGGFIQLGHDLIAAKRDLGIKYGNTAVFVEMVKADLDFSHNSANAFIRIAKWVDRRQFVDDIHKLPPDWGTIDKLTRLDDATFKRLLDDGTICPTLPRNDVASLLSKINRQQKHQSIAADCRLSAGELPVPNATYLPVSESELGPMTPNSEWHWEQGIKYAVEAIKTTLLLNGAAAIALMTFAGTHSITGGVKLAIFLFACGAMVSAVAFLAAYMTQLQYGNAEVPGVDKGKIWRKAQRWNGVAGCLVIMSVVVFVTGCAIVLHSWPTPPVEPSSYGPG